MPKGEKLKPYNWKKGQSGNPDGRPRGVLNLTTKLKVALQKIYEGTGTAYDELFIQATIKDAIKSDGQSRRLIWQYVEGMPKGSIDLTSDGKPIFLPSDLINKNETTPSPENNSE